MAAEYSDTWWDYDRWHSDKAYRRWKEERPVCAWCDEPIIEDFEYEFPNGDHVCESCVREYVDDNFRKYIG